MRVLLLMLLTLSLPIFLATTNVRALAVTPAFYEWGFRRHQVGRTTGLSPEQLRTVANEFINYFRSRPGRLDVWVLRGAKRVPLFNEREIGHMVDVQALMHRLGTVQLVAGLLILAALSGLSLLERRFLPPTAGLGLLLGAGASFAMLALLAVATLLDFGSFWTRFHLVAFSNGLWLLDPDRDNLIRLYPPAFWAEATLLIAALTALEALVAAAAGFILWATPWSGRTATTAAAATWSRSS